ncbi:class I SAM-dependent methyltransferase [Streptomyces sp. NPDC053367]|uniref:class I SAM-dependent methyltransferase n=1 Tax=Streptomyces sp. NPDC053367 TaxID=3365700 RepID=UPI0037D431EF
MSQTIETNTADYVFHNVPEQLTPLQAFLDPFTRNELLELGVPAGARCLDLGAGGGSVTRMLSGLAGPRGTVTAIDQDVHMIPGGPNITVHTQDLGSGEPLPVSGPFDIIHARLLTHHLDNRVELVHRLAGELKPGGWLLLGEFVRSKPRVVAAPSEEDAEIFRTVLDGLYDVMTATHTHGDWGHHVETTMMDAGLVNTRTRWHFESFHGGSHGCRLLQNNVAQKRDDIVAHGLPAADVDRFVNVLMTDPRMVVRSHEFISVRGQREA